MATFLLAKKWTFKEFIEFGGSEKRGQFIGKMDGRF